MEAEDIRIPNFREIALFWSSNRSTMREGGQIHMRENKPVACQFGKAAHNLWAICEGNISGTEIRKPKPFVAQAGEISVCPIVGAGMGLT
jgi:hypothetical protein